MKWSKKEERFLRVYWAGTSSRLISEVLGRSKSSINHKALDMGLCKNFDINKKNFVTTRGRVRRLTPKL